MNLILLTSGYTFTRNAVGRLRQSGQEVATVNDRWYQSPTCCSIPGDGTFWIVRNHRHCTRVFGFESWTCHPAPGHGSRIRSVHYRRHRTRLRILSGFLGTWGYLQEASWCVPARCCRQKTGRSARTSSKSERHLQLPTLQCDRWDGAGQKLLKTPVHDLKLSLINRNKIGKWNVESIFGSFNLKQLKMNKLHSWKWIYLFSSFKVTFSTN